MNIKRIAVRITYPEISPRDATALDRAARLLRTADPALSEQLDRMHREWRQAARDRRKEVIRA